MKNIFSKLNLNTKIAVIALLLGSAAIFTGNPYGGGSVSLNATELALIVEKEADHVGCEELADWIIRGKSDFRLIDLRTEKEYNDYHIPTAENTTLPGLNEYPLSRNEKIVLYSEGGIHSAQAWMLLKARGYKGVYMLMGGLDEWKERILFPQIPVNATADEITAFGKIKEISKYFGGSPQSGGAAEIQTGKKPMPKLEMPSQVPPGAQKKKPKKEGC